MEQLETSDQAKQRGGGVCPPTLVLWIECFNVPSATCCVECAFSMPAITLYLKQSIACEMILLGRFQSPS